MAILPSGNYVIQLEADWESVTVGANRAPPVPGAGSAVIAGGVHTIWEIKHQEGDVYKVDLHGNGQAIRSGEEVWVNGTLPPGISTWRIVHEKDKLYTIRLPAADEVWTLHVSDPGTKVDLKPLHHPAGPRQLWKLSRVISIEH